VALQEQHSPRGRLPAAGFLAATSASQGLFGGDSCLGAASSLADRWLAHSLAADTVPSTAKKPLGSVHGHC
jgi:hypothetical protein